MDPINNSLFTQMQSMSVEAINTKTKTSINPTGSDFSNILTKALDAVNELHQDGGKKTKGFLLGDRSIGLAEIMIARSKAGIASSAAIQVRNKAIEGYKEIMSMPV